MVHAERLAADETFAEAPDGVERTEPHPRRQREEVRRRARTACVAADRGHRSLVAVFGCDLHRSSLPDRLHTRSLEGDVEDVVTFEERHIRLGSSRAELLKLSPVLREAAGCVQVGGPAIAPPPRVGGSLLGRPRSVGVGGFGGEPVLARLEFAGSRCPGLTLGARPKLGRRRPRHCCSRSCAEHERSPGSDRLITTARDGLSILGARFHSRDGLHSALP